MKLALMLLDKRNGFVQYQLVRWRGIIGGGEAEGSGARPMLLRSYARKRSVWSPPTQMPAE